MSKSKTHYIIRTSPKGVTFIGKCVQCGAEGLMMEDVKSFCPNNLGLSQEDALIRAISGDDNKS